MENLLHVGLDVGSTTVKIVVMNENRNTIYRDYQRHFSDTKNTVCNVLENLATRYPNSLLTIALTGSGAMSAAKFLDLPFIQEVVACKRAVEKYIPQTDVSIVPRTASPHITPNMLHPQGPLKTPKHIGVYVEAIKMYIIIWSNLRRTLVAFSFKFNR